MAASIYNRALGSDLFDKACWVTVSPEPDLLACLQMLWSFLIGPQLPESWSNAEELRTELSSELQRIRVLLILDDVWNSSHLQELMITSCNPKSRILVTTRNQNDVSQLDGNIEVFGIDLLNEKQSIELFCRWAFGSRNTPQDKQKYASPAEKIAMHCKRLPLALCMMGSIAAHFRTMAEWQSCALKVQKTGLSLGGGYDKELFDVLRKSYEKLDDAEKSLFFCLVGYPEDCHVRVSDVVEHWMALQKPDGQDSDAAELLMDGYTVFRQLLHQSLVYLDESGVEESCFVHGLVRELGLRIAKEENCNMAKRDRLLFPVLQQLRGKSVRATELSTCGNSVEALPEGLCAFDLLSFIARDTGLSMLPHTLFLSTNLRILDMSGAGLSGLPHGIEQIHALVVLRLDRCSNIERLPDEITSLQQLRVLSLRECRNLKELPAGLGKLTRLLSMYVTGCGELKYLPSSICRMTDLRKLDLSNCTGLEYISEAIGSLTTLWQLDLCRCSSLKEIPETVWSLNSLKRLYLGSCYCLREIPQAIGTLTSLQKLDLSYCSRLTEIPEAIGSLTSLQQLHLGKCSSLTKIPEAIGSLTSLRQLDLHECSRFAKIPEAIGSLTGLQRLCLGWCSDFTEIPEAIGSLANLQQLDLMGCSSLTEIPEAIGSLTSLQQLHLCKCSRLIKIPNAVWSLTSLQQLDLSWCDSLTEIPAAIGSLTRLQWLDLSWCDSLTKIPNAVWSLTSLQRLKLSSCSGLKDIPAAIGSLTRLEWLDLYGCSSLTKIPEALWSLTSLQQLDLSYCSGLKEIPEAIGSLTSLQQLYLSWLFQFDQDS